MHLSLPSGPVNDLKDVSDARHIRGIFTRESVFKKYYILSKKSISSFKKLKGRRQPNKYRITEFFGTIQEAQRECDPMRQGAFSEQKSTWPLNAPLADLANSTCALVDSDSFEYAENNR